MKHEVGRILGGLERAWNREAWHGPAVREVLEGVTAAQAARRPIADAHSIWEIALHIACWEDVIRRALQGDLTPPSDEQNFPPVRDRSEAAWAAARAHLEQTHQMLVAEIERLEDEELDDAVPNGKRPRYVLLHGVIEHDLYHAGQIALLRKAKGPVATTRAPKPRRAVAMAAGARARRPKAGGTAGRATKRGPKGSKRPKRRRAGA